MRDYELRAHKVKMFSLKCIAKSDESISKSQISKKHSGGPQVGIISFDELQVDRSSGG